MRRTLFAALALAALFATVAPSFACPVGYTPCGAGGRLCCPR